MTQSVHNRVPDCQENENSLIRKASMDAGLRQRTSHFDEGEVADDDEYLDEDDSEGMAKTMTLRYHLLKALENQEDVRRKATVGNPSVDLEIMHSPKYDNDVAHACNIVLN